MNFCTVHYCTHVFVHFENIYHLTLQGTYIMFTGYVGPFPSPFCRLIICNGNLSKACALLPLRVYVINGRPHI